MTDTDQPLSPSWSWRTWSDDDLGTVLGFFDEPDFYFRTTLPALLSEAEIARLSEGCHLLLADGDPVGMWTVESVVDRSAHYELAFRLRAGTPDAWWADAYRRIAAGLAWRSEVVRLTVPVFEFDERLLRILRGLGLDEEGLLEAVVLNNGRLYGQYSFAQVRGDGFPLRQPAAPGASRESERR